jgi:hypothetical protein
MERFLGGPTTPYKPDPTVTIDTDEIISIARCPVHGRHGQRTECFVCRGPVEQVPMVSVSIAPVMRDAIADAIEGMQEILDLIPAYFRERHALDAYIGRAEATLASLTTIGNMVHLPALIARECDMPRSHARRLIMQGAVWLNGVQVSDHDLPESQLIGKGLRVAGRPPIRLAAAHLQAKEEGA